MSDPAGSAPCAPERVAPGGRLYQPCVLPAGPISQSSAHVALDPGGHGVRYGLLDDHHAVPLPRRQVLCGQDAGYYRQRRGRSAGGGRRPNNFGGAAHLQVESERIEAVCHAVTQIQYS
jgi:hypothetical protein